jgi:hypothetical protein
MHHSTRRKEPLIATGRRPRRSWIDLAPWPLLVGVTTCPAGCKAPSNAPVFEVAVRVTSDPDKPLEGARVLQESRELAITGANGIARVNLKGERGNIVHVTLKCPDDYRSPTENVAIGLRDLAENDRLPQYDVRCPPKKRSVVVAIRADNGVHLPIFYEGREVARTDSAGAAHVLLSVLPDSQFVLILGTDEAEAELLRPRNPVITFVARDYDDVLPVEHRFVTEGAPIRKAPPRPSRPSGPRRPLRLH